MVSFTSTRKPLTTWLCQIYNVLIYTYLTTTMNTTLLRLWQR